MTHYTPARFGPAAVTSAALFECIAKAGNSGATMAELIAATGKTALQIGALLDNMKGRHGCRRVMIYSLTVFGRMARYFAADVPMEIAQAVVKREGDRRRAEGKEASRLNELARKARHRAAARQRSEANRIAEQGERAKLTELAKAANVVYKADAQARKDARRRPMMVLKKGEHALSNALAKRIKADGTRGPAPAEKPAPTITGLESTPVQRAPRAPGRWEVSNAPRLFRDLPLGQYLDTTA